MIFLYTYAITRAGYTRKVLLLGRYFKTLLGLFTVYVYLALISGLKTEKNCTGYRQ